MLDCKRVVTTALEKYNQRLCLNFHTYSFTIVVGHTDLLLQRAFSLSCSCICYPSAFLRAGSCTMKAMIIIFLLIVPN